MSLDVTPPLYRKAPNLLQKLPNFSRLKALALLEINEAVAYSDAIHFIIMGTSFIKEPWWLIKITLGWYPKGTVVQMLEKRELSFNVLWKTRVSLDKYAFQLSGFYRQMSSETGKTKEMKPNSLVVKDYMNCNWKRNKYTIINIYMSS